MLYRLALSSLAILGLAAGVAAAEPKAADWPQFLGSNRNGLSSATALNLDWKAKPPKVLWKVPLGGGYSSISAVGDRLYTMASQQGRDCVFCLDASNGKVLWKQEVAATYLDVQRQGPGPRSTPTVVGDKVYCLFPLGELVCLAAGDGKQVWKVNIFQATGAANPAGGRFYWGMSGSPLVEGDVVVVQPGGNKNNSAAAFHKDTGKLVWAAGSDPVGYGSPIAIDAAGTRQIVCPTGQSLLGLEPATGKLLWRHEWGNKYNCNCATPVWADNRLFISSAYRTGCALLEITKDGDKLKVSEVWRNRDLQNQMATSMVIKGHIYGCHGDLGAVMIRCLDLATGKRTWTERKPGKSCMIAAAGHIICLSERGTLYLIEANPERCVFKGELPNVLTYKAWAPPSLAGGRLYLRDEKNVVCLDLRK